MAKHYYTCHASLPEQHCAIIRRLSDGSFVLLHPPEMNVEGQELLALVPEMNTTTFGLITLISIYRNSAMIVVLPDLKLFLPTIASMGFSVIRFSPAK